MPIKASFTGDTTDLQRSTQRARDEFRQVGREAGTTARQLQSVGSAFDGSKIEGAALRAAKGVERVGGVTRLTATELQRVARITDEAMQKFTAMGTQAPAAIQKLSRELQSAQKSAGGLSAALGSFAGGLGLGAGIASFATIGTAMRGLITEGAKVGPIALGFERMQGGAAQATRTLASMQTATRGLVADLDLMQAANRGTLLGLTAMGIDMGELASVATTLGRAVGQDATKSVDDLTIALARQSPMILDNLGIKMSLGDANKAYAASIGKSVEALTDEEKKLAFARSAMDAARAAAENLGTAQLTASEHARAAAVHFQNLALQMVSGANESRLLADGLGGVTAALTGATDSYDRLTRAAAQFRAERERGMGSVSGPGTMGVAETLGRGFMMGLGLPTAVPGLDAALLRMMGRDPRSGQTAGGLNFAEGQRRAAAAAGAGTTGAVGPIVPPTVGGPTGVPGIRLAAGELRKLDDEIARVEASWLRMLRGPQIGTVSNDLFSSTGLAGAVRTNLFSASNQQRLQGAANLPSSNPLSFVMGNQFTRMSSDMPRFAVATRDWRMELQGAAQAFAQLAQAAGPSLDGVTRSIGVTLNSANAAEELARALGMVNEAGGLTRGGRATAGGFAGLTTGMALGGLTGNVLAGGILGAGGGAAAGFLAAGTGVGAGVGLATGALGGIASAYRNQQAQRALMEQGRQDAITAAGGLEELQRQAERAGFSVDEFMRRFQSSNPREFTGVLNDMNQALAAQRLRAQELTRALDSVAQAQGVLSAQQIAQIRTSNPDGEGAEALVAFAQGQRQQSIAGILRAAAALERMASLTDTELEELTEGITDREERAGVIEAALRDRAGSVMGNLRQGVQATASAIFVAINDAVASGERLVDVLADLAPAIGTVRDLFSRSGQTPGAGFAQVESFQRIASGPQTGPALELATGLGQAMAAFSNTGLLSPELFQEMAAGIGAAYKQMENLGQGGLDAARLMQPALQNIWQLIQDNPGLEGQLNDDTRALLDFAAQSGLIGDKFRPAIDRMIDGLDRLIGRLDDFIARMSGLQGMTFPGAPDGPAPGGAPARGADEGDRGGSGGDFGGAPRPLAAGGVVTRPTVALIGEGGEPEAVVPLSRWADFAGPQQQTITVQVGQQVIARAAVRGMPREWRLVGV